MARVRKLTGRKLAFVEQYLVSRDPEDAVIKAGYRPNMAANTATNLLADPDVQLAIVMHDKEEKPGGVSLDTLTEELDEAICLARMHGHTSAMVSAIKTKAQLHKLLIEQSEARNAVDHKISGAEGIKDRIKALVEVEMKNALR